MIVRKFHIAKVLTYWTLPLVNCSTLYPVCRYGFSNENCDTPKLVRCGIQVGQQLAHPWRQEAVQSVCMQPRSAIPLPPQQLQQHEQQAQQVGPRSVLKAFKYTISICLSFLREQRVNEIIDFIATERNYKKKRFKLELNVLSLLRFQPLSLQRLYYYYHNPRHYHHHYHHRHNYHQHCYQHYHHHKYINIK